MALSNLVENALRHGGGEITLAARGEGESVIFEVTDAGPGIDDEFAARAFERFARPEAGRTGAGHGLGLAIVKAIAESHGGEVQIDPVGLRGPGDHARSALAGERPWPGRLRSGTARRGGLIDGSFAFRRTGADHDHPSLEVTQMKKHSKVLVTGAAILAVAAGGTGVAIAASGGEDAN